MPRHRFLRCARQPVRALVVEQGDFVFVRTDRVLRQVGDHQRHFLAAPLLVGIGIEVAAFGGEADAKRRVGARRDPGEDVRVRHQPQCELALFGLLDLVPSRLVHPVVGHGGDADVDIGARDVAFYGLEHVGRGRDLCYVRAGRRGEADRPRDQRDPGAGVERRAGDGVAHLARAAVGNAAHGVDRLERRSGGDQHACAGEQFWRDQAGDRLRDIERFEHSAHAGFAARLVAAVGAQYRHAVALQALDVAARGGVLPHLAVHGGGDDQRAFAREAQRREQVVREPVGELGDEIGRGGGNDDRVLAARELDVRHVVGDAGIPHVGVDRLARQRLEGRRRHHASCRFGHDHLHVDAMALQVARELRRLVSGDASGDTQDD